MFPNASKAINVTASPINPAVAYETEMRWKRYLEAGGPRKRIISDFLIGEHAVAVADNFITRNRGFFSTYFPELEQMQN